MHKSGNELCNVAQESCTYWLGGGAAGPFLLGRGACLYVMERTRQRLKGAVAVIVIALSLTL